MKHSENIAATPDELKLIIAANIAYLRKKEGMTQQELAGKLNYTDKAISKWERGESIPDVIVLKQIADMFHVTVDYLLCKEHEDPPAEVPPDQTEQQNYRTRGFVTGMSVLLVWLAAFILFIIFDTVPVNALSHWIVFSCAVSASFILWLIMNTIWFNRRRNYLIISLLMWSLLILVYVSVQLLTANSLWLIFLLGLPGQAIIIMWSRLKQDGKK